MTTDKIITSFFKYQNFENFKAYLSTLGDNYVVLSHESLQVPNNIVLPPFPISPPDEAIRLAFEYLKSIPQQSLQSENFIILDWESVSSISSLTKDLDSLVEVDKDLFLVEEKVTVQDLRLAPFMENILKICFDLNLSGTDLLFSKNPKALIPRLIKGTRQALLESCKKFLEIRFSIKGEKFTGTLPIYNCLYANRR